MKIIIVGPAYPLRGGIANFNEALAHELSLAGHEVEIVSFSLQYPKLLFPGKSQTDTQSEPVFKNIQQKINSVNPISWYRTANYIKSKRPDLVIFRYWLPFMAPALGTIAKQLKTFPKIAITDNVLPHEKRKGDKTFTKYFIKHCDAFVAMSKSVLEDLEKFDTKKPKLVLPHPLYSIFGESVSKQQARTALHLDVEANYLLFFGLVRKYKGLDLLLEAFAKTDYKKHNLHLIIAGEFYDNEQIYNNQIEQLGIKNQVIVHNKFIPSEEVKYYFAAANLITQTYKTATQSGVTQIAYHFNRPMLVTDVGGLSEIVPNDVCGYVTNQDPTLIAMRINQFFERHEEDKMSKAVEQEKKRFEWSFFTKGLLALSEKIKA